MKRKTRKVMIAVLFILIIAVSLNRFFIQPLNRLISTTYYPAKFEDAPKETLIIETPEVFELLYIMAHLGGYGGLGLRSEEYLARVDEYFSDFRDHRSVKGMRAFFGSGSLYELGFSFSMGIEDGKLYSRGPYSVDALFEEHDLSIEEIEDFIAVSGFESFYAGMEETYAAVQELFLQLVPLEDIRDWFEHHFTTRHQVYRILISPMATSMQYAYIFRDRGKGISEMVISVPAVNPHHVSLYEQEEISYEQLVALSSLEVFTEIAHGYVNPATDKYLHLAGISGIFKDIDFWHTGIGYGLQSMVFNEYLTWTAYILYCHDRFSPETRKIIEKVMGETMEKRGFIRFPVFAGRLLEHYTEVEVGEENNLESSYPDILTISGDIRDTMGPSQDM